MKKYAIEIEVVEGSQKEIDLEGLTTEYVRCPDPTDRGIVVRISRTPLVEG